MKEQENLLGKIASFFIGRYRVVYLMIIAIALLGTSAYMALPREEAPEITFPYGMVSVSYMGAAPNEMESLITDKLENKLEGIEDIKSMNSTSGNGISTVQIEFEPDVDMDKKLQDMRNKVSEVQGELPEDSTTPVVRTFETGSRPIMMLTVSGDYDLITLKSIAENIQDHIEKVNGIKEVEILGGLDREISIYVDPSKLATYGVSMSDIQRSIQGANLNIPGGDVELDGLEYNIRTVSEFKKVDELKNLMVSSQKGNIYLKDIARIEDSYEKPDSYSEMYQVGVSKKDTMTPTISLSVMRKDDADIIGASEEIKDIISKQKGKLYPDDVFISINGDQATNVKDALDDVVGNALSGLFTVIIVLFLFIGFRESVIVSFVIPLSLLTSFVLMDATGITFNGVSIVALILALGMLVDNAIVIMENIDRYRQDGFEIAKASKIATNQVAPAVMASTLTTMAAFAPMSMLDGIMGKFLRIIPLTVMFAIGASFVISMVITPALCARFLSKHKASIDKNKTKLSLIRKALSVVFVVVLSLFAFKEDGHFGILSFVCATLFGVAMYFKQFHAKSNSHENMKIIQWYVKMMKNILEKKRRRIMVVGISIVLFVASLATIPLGILKIQMMPKTDATHLSIDVKTPSGSLLEDNAMIFDQIEKTLFKYKEIDNFTSKVQKNKGSVSIDLVPLEERNLTSMELTEKIRQDIKNIAGAKITVGQSSNGPSVGAPISLELKGESLESLTKVSNDFEKILENIQGVKEISSSVSDGSPQIQVVVNKEQAALYGLSPQSIGGEINRAIHGSKASTFKDGQDEIDIVVRTHDDQYSTLKDLQKVYIRTPKGENISLTEVVSIVETKGPVEIEHEDGQRILTVEANLSRGVMVGETLQKFQKQIKNYSMPEDVELSFGGEAEATRESFSDMAVKMIMAVLLVYIILSVQFNSLSQPLVILFSVPLATIGVMIGLILTHNNFGMFAFMGVVSLVGIAVNDAIVLVDYINYLRKKGMGMKESIQEAGKTRFLPVFATSITTIGGILPLALKSSEYGEMGFALVFGLVASTVLTLLIIPVIYSLSEEFKVWMQKKIPVFTDEK